MKYILIAFGGMLGAMARFSAESITIGDISRIFPVNTLLINAAGCFALAAVLTIAYEIWEMDPALRLGIATGFLGAFTTFSTYCRETAELLSAGAVGQAVLYALGSVLLGLISVYLGVSLSRKMIARLERGGGSL